MLENAGDTCSDPRVVMLHILAGKLMLMSRWGDYDESQAEKEINAVLPNPTIEEANIWLECNGFGGKNRKVSKEGANYPGWDIAYDDFDLEALSPEIQTLYYKYKKLWKENDQNE